MQNTCKQRVREPKSQFELTTNLLRNLNQFELTPTAKLVLLELTTHINDSNVIFPSMQFISETLGIGLTSTKQAIKDLIAAGIIMKSKRSVSGNNNKYIFTSKVQIPTVERSKSELLKGQNPTVSCITKKEQIKNKVFFKNFVSEEEKKQIREKASKRIEETKQLIQQNVVHLSLIHI